MKESDKNMSKDTPYEIVLTPLKSGGWIPVKNRHTASYVFRINNTLFILDFGTGISRLLKEFDSLLNGVENIIGFLSHYHPDHTVGLFYLPPVIGPRNFKLYAPGKDVYDKPASSILNGIFHSPFMPRKLSDMIPDIQIIDMPIDGLKINGLNINFKIQKKHIHPSVAIRIGNHFVYCTDTEPEYETVGFSMGVKILLHECWYEDDIPANNISSAQIKDLLALCGKNGHSSNLAVALIGREARVQSVYSVHHNPDMTDKSVVRMIKNASRISTVNMEPCEDGSNIQC